MVTTCSQTSDEIFRKQHETLFQIKLTQVKLELYRNIAIESINIVEIVSWKKLKCC